METLRNIGAILYKILIIIGRCVSIGIFVIIFVGIVYYYIKPDLPPQEIRTLLGEFSPSTLQALASLVPDIVFDFVGINPSY